MKHSTVAVPLIFCCLIAGAAWAGGAATADQDFKILERKVERLEQEVRGLSKAVRTLEKSLAAAHKEASALRKTLTALSDRCAERELLLGEWFDKYHPKSDGRWHREAIRRIR